MASKANLGLRDFIEHLVGWAVNLVTTVARHTTVLVGCAIPVAALAATVASQTLARALFVTRLGIHALFKDHIGSSSTAGTCYTFNVFLTRTMARLTRRRPRVSLHSMLGLVNGEDGGALALVVTTRANSVFS